MSISKQIGRNVARIRTEQDISLSALAERSNLSKATLSELERGTANPTISTVWALANALGVPFGELVSDTDRYLQSLTDESASVHLIERHLGPPQGESYLLQLAPGGQRVSAPHGRGVREQATVLSGRIKAGPIAESGILGVGETLDFCADRPHGYFSLGEAASVLVRMEYPDVPPFPDDNIHWLHLPTDNAQWNRLEALTARLWLATSQSGNAHSLRITADAMSSADEQRLRKLAADCTRTPGLQAAQGFIAAHADGVELVILPVPTTHIDLGPLPDIENLGAVLRTAALLPALHNATALTSSQIDRLRTLQLGDSALLRALAEDIHAVHGQGGEVAADDAQAPRWDSLTAWQAVALASSAYRQIRTSTVNALVLDNTGSHGLQPMLEELCPAWVLTSASLETLPASTHADGTPTFQLLLAADILQQDNAALFLHRAMRSLDAGGLLLLAEDLTGRFAHPRDRIHALMRHHLARLLPPLAGLARSASDTAPQRSAPALVLLKRLPAIAADMLRGDIEQAAAAVKRLRRDLPPLNAKHRQVMGPLGILVDRLYQQLQALEHALDLPEELATHPERLLQLAQREGLQLLEHRRIYPSDGPHELDAGTHLFVFECPGTGQLP